MMKEMWYPRLPETLPSNIIDNLYDEEEYENVVIKNMTNSGLIRAIIELRENASDNKRELECYLLDNKKEINKYKKILKPKKGFFIKIAQQDTEEWLEDLPLYNALIYECNKRKIGDYLDIILKRYEVK